MASRQAYLLEDANAVGTRHGHVGKGDPELQVDCILVVNEGLGVIWKAKLAQKLA